MNVGANSTQAQAATTGLKGALAMQESSLDVLTGTIQAQQEMTQQMSGVKNAAMVSAGIGTKVNTVA